MEGSQANRYVPNSSHSMNPSSNPVASSLHAPSRQETIDIDAIFENDDIIQQERLLPSLGNNSPAKSDSSESDDDENDNLPVVVSSSVTQRGKIPSRPNKRGLGKKSHSSLSLESLHNEVAALPDDKTLNPTSSTAQNTSLKPLTTNQNPTDPWPATPTQGFKRRRVSNDPSHINPHPKSNPTVNAVGMISQSTKKLYSSASASESVKNSAMENRITSSSKMSDGTAELVKHQQKATNQSLIPNPKPSKVVSQHKSIINIANTWENDGILKDRFIISTFRPRRFDFNTNVYLSQFSPFAAVKTNKKHSSPNIICATCGGIFGKYVVCIRCPLMFHVECIVPKRPNLNPQLFMCNACQAVKGYEMTVNWFPNRPPPPLPALSTGFPRLIADVNDGNALDHILHPTLFVAFKKNCGADWLRCHKCKQIRIVPNCVIGEAVRMPFDCSKAFWEKDVDRRCKPPSALSSREKDKVKRVESYIKERSRQRNALFFFEFGEENRTDYGFPVLSEIEEPGPAAKVNKDANNRAVEVTDDTQATMENKPHASSQEVQTSVEPEQSKNDVLHEKVIPIKANGRPSTVVVAMDSSTSKDADPKNERQTKAVQDSPVRDLNQANSSKNLSMAGEVKPSITKASADCQVKKEQNFDKPAFAPSAKYNDKTQDEILESIPTWSLDMDVEEKLVDLVLESDQRIVKLFNVYGGDTERFKRHVIRLSRRLIGTDTSKMQF